MSTESLEATSAAPLGHNKPPRSYGKAVCGFCGCEFTRTHHRQANFCCTEHGRAFQDMARVRGREIYLLAMAWREGRHGGDAGDKSAAKTAFADLCRALDEFSSEDRKAKRPKAVRVLRRQAAFSQRD